MCSTTFHEHPSYTTNAFLSGVRSFGTSIGDAFCATTQKIKDAVTSPVGQGVIGFGLGTGLYKLYDPLTKKIVKSLGVSTSLPDPLSNLSLNDKILLTPYVCVLGPLIEEIIFRGFLPRMLQDRLEPFYVNRGFSDSAANTAARITSVFFSSLLFGLIHFANAIGSPYDPALFLPQVVACTISGLIFGLAKEFSGELHMPFGMHIGNNTLAWALYLKAFL